MARNADHQRERRNRLKEAGLCSRCTEPRGESASEWYCLACLASLAEQAVKRAAAKAARGTCTRCLLPAVPGGKLCEDCRAKLARRNNTEESRAYQRERNAEGAVAGKCSRCPAQALPGRKSCAACAAKSAAAQARRRQK